MSREIANCAAREVAGEETTTKMYIRGYVFYVYSIARPFESFMTPCSPDDDQEARSFSYVRSNFAEKFPRAASNFARELLVRPLFIGRRPRYLIIVNLPGISSASEREYSHPPVRALSF